ncbi:hypothetical protein M23134_06797 [Microscilla marina ATCC 23134]|uniref:Uncharacterized protein n=1 Tax=Microscilla marina ATCC 23134 TaxID=313606 RepID=A1ZWR9_MICM2|nr:hypothetical protein M23134_06797 [Microscilla marina ATCC 23134]
MFCAWFLKIKSKPWYLNQGFFIRLQIQSGFAIFNQEI